MGSSHHWPMGLRRGRCGGPWCSSSPVVPLALGEAHFRADAELRGKWVLKGEPALVDSTSPRRGEAVREYLRTSGFGIRLVNLPGYSPDFNADEAIWGWVREEATGTCAWEPRRRCRKGSATSSPSWPSGKMK